MSKLGEELFQLKFAESWSAVECVRNKCTRLFPNSRSQISSNTPIFINAGYYGQNYLPQLGNTNGIIVDFVYLIVVIFYKKENYFYTKNKIQSKLKRGMHPIHY